MPVTPDAVIHRREQYAEKNVPGQQPFAFMACIAASVYSRPQRQERIRGQLGYVFNLLIYHN